MTRTRQINLIRLSRYFKFSILREIVNIADTQHNTLPLEVGIDKECRLTGVDRSLLSPSGCQQSSRSAPTA